MKNDFSDDEVNAIFQQAAQNEAAQTDEKVELNQVTVLQTETGLSRDQVIAIGRESGFSNESIRSAIERMERDQEIEEFRRKSFLRFLVGVGISAIVAAPITAAMSWATADNIYYEAYHRHSQSHLLAAGQANTTESAEQSLSEALPWLKEQAAVDDQLPAQEAAAISDLSNLSRSLDDSSTTLLTEEEKTAIDQSVETIDSYYRTKSFASRIILVASGIGFGACFVVVAALFFIHRQIYS